MSGRPLVLGTAGHIDHGKTALVRALTGVDTDRLQEEKARGISIDIGFARLEIGDRVVGIVDVPGHERFIRNMLAGASGIDLALLVVAADDAVMPQTREHLAILELLRLRGGVIALTKCDLVEPSWLDLVEEDIRGLVDGTFLAGAPIVRTSAVSGAGLDDLKAALDAAASALPERAERDLFRIAVDRSFARPGRGTVVTGTIASGRVSVEDVLAWLPRGESVRVRGLHSHGSEAQTLVAGQRAALNLSGVHHSAIERGHELVTPGVLRPSRRITVRLRVLPDAPWPVKHRARVRVHIGTQEHIAEVRLLDAQALGPDERGLAQLVSVEPMVASTGEPLVLRAESPVRTLGGGVVLQPAAPRLRRNEPGLAERLAPLPDGSPEARAEAATYFFGARPWTIDDLRRDADLSGRDAAEAVASLRASGVLVTLTAGRMASDMHRDAMEQLAARIETVVARLHEKHPLDPRVPWERLRGRLAREDEAVLRGVVNHLVAARRLQGDEQAVRLKGRTPALTEAQRALYETVRTAYRDAGFRPPDPGAVVPEAAEKQVREIIKMAVAQGELVHVQGDVYLHREQEEALRSQLQAQLAGPGLTVSEIKTTLDTSRKFAVPICEYLDRVGFTKRVGDRRVLAG